MLTPLFEDRLDQCVLVGLSKVKANPFIYVLCVSNDSKYCLNLVQHVTLEIFALFVPNRYLPKLSEGFEKKSHLIMIERHVVFYHCFFLISSLMPPFELLFHDFELTLIKSRLNCEVALLCFPEHSF